MTERSEDQFQTTVNVGPEGMHAMTKEGVSKVDPVTGKGLFRGFTMTSKANPNISFTGSHTEAGLKMMQERHGEKWDIKTHD